MQLYKIRITETKGGKWMIINHPPIKGFIAEISAVFYDDNNITTHLHLKDADGDEFLTIAGQSKEEGKTPDPYIFPHPIPVKLPIAYYDENPEGKNKLLIWGKMRREQIA